MKLCKDCKWVIEVERGEYAKCINPKVVKVSVVDGSLIPKYCDIARDLFSCPRGRHFEPKVITNEGMKDVTPTPRGIKKFLEFLK